MKEFLLRNKTILAAVVGTILLLVGGVYFFSKDATTGAKPVSSDILIPKDAIVAGGIANGVYQPANASPKITLVEFGDYECPACGAYSPLVKQILTEFNGKVNYVFRNFPLSQHKNAPLSSYAAEAAGFQGKLWQMHDKLYETQNDWAVVPDPKPIFIGFAKDMGLNVSQFTSDIDSQKVKDIVARDEGDGNLVGLTATPTFYINGFKVENLPGSYNEFKAIIENAINKAPVPSGTPVAYHAHFDLKTYINGIPVNFALSKYQESKDNPLNSDIHFHDGNGKVVHIHKQNVALSALFDSFKLSFTDKAGYSLKVYVNGNLNSQGLAYVPQDLDKILVSFGPKEDSKIQYQLSTVSNDACIYSLKCPDRGTPPPEECAGGLGTGCEVQ